VRTSGCSRSPTGPRWTCGSTSRRSGSRSRRMYYSHQRAVVKRMASGCWWVTRRSGSRPGEKPETRTVRFRTVGDMPLHRRRTESPPRRLGEIIVSEVARPRLTERGARGRQDERGGDGRPQEGRVLLMTTETAEHASRQPDRSMPTRHDHLHRVLPGHGPAALPDLRQRRRRQVDPDRSPAVRLQVDLRGPAGGDRAAPQASATTTHRPVAADRRPARRARAGHHHRRGLPLLRHAQAQVHHRRHAPAMCSTRATWSRARRPPTWPCA
jgi:hypothetical protein